MHDLVGKVAGILAVLAYVPYITSIVRGKTKPERATWVIWTMVGVLALASYRASGAEQTIWLAVAYAACPFVVVVLSLWYGQGGWTRLDQTCLLLVIASLVIWWLLSSALSALLIHLTIDFLGLVPTIKKVYFQPESESRAAWTISSLGCLVNLFAIDQLSFAIIVHPVYHFVGGLSVLSLLWWPRTSPE